MTRDQFDTWLADPVTRWVFAGIRNAVEAEQAEWQRVSWGNGVANQRVLDQLRDRASALSELADNGFDTWQEWNGETSDGE